MTHDSTLFGETITCKTNSNSLILSSAKKSESLLLHLSLPHAKHNNHNIIQLFSNFSQTQDFGHISLTHSNKQRFFTCIHINSGISAATAESSTPKASHDAK
jgi:hypothetical protein